MAGDVVSFWEAVSSLGPYIGAGGITAIVVAYLGTRKAPQQSNSQRPQDAMSAGIGAMLADHFALERLTAEIAGTRAALEVIGKGIHRYCDLMDITQAFGRLREQDREKE